MKTHSYTVRSALASLHGWRSEELCDPVEIPDELFKAGQHDRFLSYLRTHKGFDRLEGMQGQDLLGAAVGLFFEPPRTGGRSFAGPTKAVIFCGGAGDIELHIDRVGSVETPASVEG